MASTPAASPFAATLNGTTTRVAPTMLATYHKNPRRGDTAVIAGSLRAHGQYKPICANVGTYTGRPNEVLAGNHTLMAFRDLALREPDDPRWGSILVHWVDVDDDMAERIVVADNRASEVGGTDNAALLELLQGRDEAVLEGMGYTAEQVGALAALVAEGHTGTPGGGQGGEPGSEPPPPVPLSSRFVVPPFSVLDRRSGEWQDRKREWLDMGIESGEGRDDVLTFDTGEGIRPYSEAVKKIGDLSIFDPLLCEIVYKWYSTPGSRVLDPFAGGSVRGVVASALKRHYTGVDVRAEQIDANNEQLARLRMNQGEHQPRWLLGDATQLYNTVDTQESYDLVFSCPPYADLEVYSDHDRDISTWSYEEFVVGHRAAIADATALLAEDRYAVWVIGDLYGKDGTYRGLVHETVEAFKAAGLRILNELVMVDPVGSTRLRAGILFERTRKTARLHQHVIVALKGDVKRAAQRVLEAGGE